MSSKQPYIGAPVTLISSLDVRYEGVLFTIDPNESTVALQNVKCLGTEDRQPPGEKSIPKSDTVYEFIIFRGENIKSISLLEKNDPAKEDRHPIPDPSILKVGPPEPKSTPHQRPSRNFDMNRDYNRRPQRQYNNNRYQDRRQYNNQRFQENSDNRRQGGQRQYQQRRPQWRDRQNYNRGYRNNNNRRYNNYRDQNRRPYDPQSAPGTGKFLMKGNDEQEELVLQDEFDFEAANSRFEKNVAVEEEEIKDQSSEEKKEASASAEDNKEEKPKEENEEGNEEKEKAAEPETQAKPEEPQSGYTYDPDNFFDDLDDGKDHKSYKQDLKARRAVDAQTFGDVAKSYSPRVFRRRRYRNNNRQGNNNYRRNNQNYYRRNNYDNDRQDRDRRDRG